MWVDPPPIPPLQSYIDHLESHIETLEQDLAALAPAKEDELVIRLDDKKWCDNGPRCRCRTTSLVVPTHLHQGHLAAHSKAPTKL